MSDKALGEGVGGGGTALVTPSYTNVQCPRCGHSPMARGGVCPACGYKASASDGGEPKDAFTIDLDIKSVEEDEKGTLILKGYGSTWIEDRDEETVVKTAFAESLEEFLANPVLLLGHDKKRLIGKVTSAVPDWKGLAIIAEVPKPPPGSEAWHIKAYSDIKNGLLRAFSIGGRFLRDSSRKFIEKVKLFELSVIPVPSNPASLFEVVGVKEWKLELDWDGKAPASISQDQRDQWAKSGVAMPDGSFPIPTRDFLRRAIQSFGRGSGDKAAIKRHIIKRARALGAEDMLPDDWKELEFSGIGEKGGAMSGEAGTKDAKQVIEIKAEDWEKTQATITALVTEKEARDKESEVERLAKEKIAADEKAAKDEAEQKSKRDAEIKAAVDERIKAIRAGTTTGTKHVWSGDGNPAGGAQKDYRLSAYMRDLVRSKHGDFDAFKRLKDRDEEAANSYKEAGYEVKAYSEGTNTAGGFLVPPQYLQEGIAEFRIAMAKVRQLCTVIRGINSNSVLIPRETGISSVGWTAENAAKPATDATYGQISVGIYTLAGISKVSRQLLEDSSPAVDALVRRGLGKALGQAEDLAAINGNGTGQPTGILQTAGILTGAVGTKLWSSIAGAISSVQSNYFANPTAILAHPRDINTLRTTTDTAGRPIFLPNYWQGAGPQVGGAAAFLAGDADRAQQANFPMAIAPDGYVFGLPVYSDANIPTNLGAGTNETRMIIGDFTESYFFERVGMNMDVSSEAGTSFEQNQIWFRAEERVGFTAARQPSALYVMTGLTPGAGL